MELFGIRLLGLSAQTGRKLLLSLAILAVLWIVVKIVHLILQALHRRGRHPHIEFWAGQIVRVVCTVTAVLALVSIWFADQKQATTVLGLFTAGLAFALQRVVTALAGYLIILRGSIFQIGDRIKMGGVRGDVISIGFLQTRIMEMGQPPAVQQEDPGMWIEARQYTGRIVSVTNDRIFDEPVYNLTTDFPYLWEEIHLPISYTSDFDRGERILIEAAQKYAVGPDAVTREAAEELQRRYFMSAPDLGPRVFYKLTDNWIELSLRFVVGTHDVREVKDRMFRYILAELKKAGMGVASSTFEIVGLPPLRITREPVPAISP